jgi:electron transport complex protein RnfG
MVTWFKEKANLKGRKMDLNNPLKVSKEASKDGGEVQAITAATISSRAFIEVVNNAYRIANGHDATTGATDVD